MSIIDWRSISPERMAPLFELERQRWLTNLYWDCTPTLADIESARIDGRLPGFVAIDGDTIVGWSYHLVHRDALHVGGLVASSEEITTALLDATLNSREGQTSRSTIVFGYFDAPGFERALTDRGMSTESYRYLVRTIDGAGSVGESASIDRYPLAEPAEVAKLLQRAYESEPALRPFARSDQPEEWLEYVMQLTYSNGCGIFDARSSMVVRDRCHRVVGAALVSRIADDTLHLGQVAIDPESQGRGLGQQLLERVIGESSRSRVKRMTLLVADSSAAARRLYDRMQFVEAGQFVMATDRIAHAAPSPLLPDHQHEPSCSAPMRPAR